ncbi:MAG TPA: methionine synthase [Lachnospiraceae bacterium]|nr:methionine synthase [Lachnospiraceae bacterium]
MIQARLTELNENEILLYLGYRGQEYPAEVEAQIRRCEKEVLAAAVPRLIWRRLPVNRADFSVLPLEGKDIRELLAGCDEAVLMAVTLGQGIDRLLVRSGVSNMADAVIMDACASTAIENVADNFEMDLRRELEAENLYLTDRFSPGYGDLPLAVQRQFCAVLDTERKIGLSVSSSMLMIPGKSVTAVLGISGRPKPLRKRGCESCSLFCSCMYRKEGKSCHEK